MCSLRMNPCSLSTDKPCVQQLVEARKTGIALGQLAAGQLLIAREWLLVFQVVGCSLLFFQNCCRSMSVFLLFTRELQEYQLHGRHAC
jgi:hypothetical protein